MAELDAEVLTARLDGQDRMLRSIHRSQRRTEDKLDRYAEGHATCKTHTEDEIGQLKKDVAPVPGLVSDVTFIKRLTAFCSAAVAVLYGLHAIFRFWP